MKSRRIIFWILLPILSLVLLEGVLQLTSLFVADKAVIGSEAPASNQIWTFGESTSVWGGDQSYPNILQKKIEQVSAENFQVVNYAVMGSDSEKQLKAFLAALEHAKPKMVIAMLGINDDWALSNEKETNFRAKLWPLRTYRFAYFIYLNYFKDLLKAKSILIPMKGYYYPPNLNPEVWPVIEKLVNQKKYSDIEKLIDQQPAEFKRDYFYVASITVSDKYGSEEDLQSVNQQIYFLTKCLAIDPEYLPCIEQMVENKCVAKHSFESIEPYLKLALDKKSDYPNVFQAALNEYRKVGQTEKGLTIVEQFLKQHPVDYFFLWRNFIESMPEDTDPGRRTYWKNLYEKEFPGRTNSTNESKLKEHFETHSKFVSNLKEFVELCAANNIQFVFVQYPRLSIAKIKEIPDHSDKVIWVENKNNFENALKTHTYEDLFTDRFSTSFGHFTPFGAELVAEEVFKNIKNKLH